MTDMPHTARFSLPMLAVAQAQKEVTHNEALALIDALIQPAVETGPIVDAPTDAEEGQCWLVGTGATGVWAGRDDALAVRTSGGWRFAAPRPGMRVLCLADASWLCFDGGGWVAAPAISPPAGGAMVDVEARAAIAALVSILAMQGLLIAA